MIGILGITWGAPEHLIFFPFLLIALFFLLYRFRHIRHALKILAGRWQRLLIKHFSNTKSFIKIVLFMVGLFFLFLTLLRPQWNKKEEKIAQEGRDIFIALDISRSMLAQDCKPDRLTCAKNKIKKLLHLLSAERAGLILFSGSAFVQCPLTADYSAFELFLNQVDVENISSGSTALDQALKVALETYERMPERKNKLLIVLTDGEDFSSNLSQFKQRAQQAGLHVFTMGIGTKEGAPIPLYNEKGIPIGHQKDNNGSIVISRLNEGILRALAQDAGGTYIALTQDDSDVRTLASRVQQYEKEALEDKSYAQLEEQYPYFLFVSFVCFALEWLL